MKKRRRIRRSRFLLATLILGVSALAAAGSNPPNDDAVRSSASLKTDAMPMMAHLASD